MLQALNITHWVQPKADVDASEMIKSIPSTEHAPRPIGRPANSLRIPTALFELQTR